MWAVSMSSLPYYQLWSPSLFYLLLFSLFVVLICLYFVLGGVFYIPSHLTPETSGLLSSMLHVDPMKRATMQQIKWVTHYKAKRWTHTLTWEKVLIYTDQTQIRRCLTSTERGICSVEMMFYWKMCTDDMQFCFCCIRNHDWFRKDLPIYLFPSSALESDIIDQECLTQVCEVGIFYLFDTVSCSACLNITLSYWISSCPFHYCWKLSCQ